MRITEQPAFILHARAWRETSLLLEAFTWTCGRVGLVARGVRGQRARLQRSALEPFQALRLDWSGRGELGTLTAAEPEGPPWQLHGDRLLSGLYVNELLVRLTARDDPNPSLFERYAALLSGLSDAPSVPWALRRFERDLLAAIGYALPLTETADDGAAIDPGTVYDYVPGAGAMVAGSVERGVRIRGSALLALAADADPPPPSDLADLRHLMRTVIGVHVGERGLQSWRVLAASRRPD